MNDTAKYITLILIGLILILKSYAQDTIRIDSKIEYFAESDSIDILNYHFKNIYSRAEYSREFIRYSEDSAKMESCFYYDNKRYIHFYDTKFFITKNDSILKVQYGELSENWIYKKLNDSLFSIKILDDYSIESGFAKSIMPLEKIDTFVTKRLNGDMLWHTVYERNYIPLIEPFIVITNDKIFDFSEVDSLPKYLNGDSLLPKTLMVSSVNKPIWESSLSCSLILLNFVVDTNGFIKNINIEFSCGDVYFEKTAMMEVLKIKQLKPGIKSGEPVNTKIRYPVRFKW